MHIDDRLSPEAFIRIHEVMVQVALGRSTIYSLIKAGRFPAPYKLTERASAWLVGEVRDWKTDPLGWRAEAQATAQGNEGA